MSQPQTDPVKAYLETIGARGGSVKNERKAAAARANGARGGRPRKASDADKQSVSGV